MLAWFAMPAKMPSTPAVVSQKSKSLTETQRRRDAETKSGTESKPETERHAPVIDVTVSLRNVQNTIMIVSIAVSTNTTNPVSAYLWRVPEDRRTLCGSGFPLWCNSAVVISGKNYGLASITLPKFSVVEEVFIFAVKSKCDIPGPTRLP